MRSSLPYVAVLALAGALGAALTLGRPRAPSAPGAAEPAPSASLSGEEPPPPPEPEPEPVEPVAAVPDVSSAECPAGMALVDGVHCPYLAHRCAERAGRSACRRYARRSLCDGPSVRRRFCVDVLEYPNQRGMMPAVGVDFDAAAAACAVEGKRLCTALEWSLACETSKMRPLPTGLRVDGQRCPVDRQGTRPLPGAAVVAADYRAPAGSHPGCASGFGVEDLAGSVAEWVVSPQGNAEAPPFAWGLAGGSAARGDEVGCRVLETDRPRGTRAFSVGFRCCADGKAGGKRAEEERPGRRGPRPVEHPAEPADRAEPGLAAPAGVH